VGFECESSSLVKKQNEGGIVVIYLSRPYRVESGPAIFGR
jgi:hypothetical protein